MPDIKYALYEFERRFLMRQPPDLSAYRYADIEDRYLISSRLRLRKVSHADGSIQYKLCKKYVPQSDTVTPLVNIYLDEGEYDLLAVLPGLSLTKRRHYLETEHGPFAIDQFQGNLTGLYLSEAERDSKEALETMELPEWVEREVTHLPEYQGINLASASFSDLPA